jgi:hypothetical protein
VLAESGADLTLERCAVRDNKPDVKSSAGGQGVSAEGGEVTLTDCLLSGNGGDAVRLVAAKGRVERCVLRDTLVDPGATGPSGHGVFAASDSGGKATDLALRDSVVAGNAVGIAAVGSAGVVERTVVRDTAGTPSAPGGIGVWIEPYQAPSAKLTLRECLITHSTLAVPGDGIGAVVAKNGEVVLERTAVQKTSLHPSITAWNGFGIAASTTKLYSAAARVTLDESIVAQNLSAGLFLQSASATVERSVIRDTSAFPGDKTGGQGVQAHLFPSRTRLPTLKMSDSLVSGNTEAGVQMSGGTATVARTIVRDSLTQPKNGRMGYGVIAQLDSEAGKHYHAKMTVTDSLVTGNTTVGAMGLGSDLTLERSVVSATRPTQAKTDGLGIFITIDDRAPAYTPTLTLKDSLVSGNLTGGVGTYGGKLTITGSVIRETRSAVRDSTGGFGIWSGSGTVVKGVTGPRPADVRLTEVVLASNDGSGIFATGSTVRLDRVAVRDTGDKASGSYIYGAGVAVAGEMAGSVHIPARLWARDCLVERSRAGGIFVSGSTIAQVLRSEVRETAGSGGKYGDGLTVWNATLDLAASHVNGSARANLLITTGKGSARGSAFQSATFAVHSDSPGFVVAEDNVFKGNTVDGVAQGRGLTPAPPPKMPSSFEP